MFYDEEDPALMIPPVGVRDVIDVRRQAPGARERLERPHITPYVPPRPPSLRERILGGLFPAPESLQGLLSPEDLASARSQGMLALGGALLEAGGPTTGVAPSLGQAIGRGVTAGSNAFQGALQGAMQLSKYSDDLKSARAEKAKLANIEQGRAKIMQKYGVNPNATSIDQLRALVPAIPELIAIGDTEMVGKLVQLLSSQGDALSGANKATNYQEIDAGDRVILIDPVTKKTVGVIPKGAVPKAPGLTDAQEAVELQRRFQRESSLSKEYAAAVKQFGPVAEYYANAKGSEQAALGGDPIAQHSLIFNYMHVLEPTSIVREGEYGAVARRNGVPERYAILLDQFKRGTFMPPNMIRGLQAEIERIVQAKYPMMEQRMQQFRRRAQRYGIDPADVIFDPFTTGDDTGGAGGEPNASGLPDVRAIVKKPGGGR